ncbi:MAG TPA: BatD family protein [Prolixibacteraceae bacterium]|nr:BatD family protein [Prolixibacteraceae bacterium]
MYRKWIILFLLLTGLSSLANDIRFTMSAPEIVASGEQFSLTLSLNASGQDLRMPDIPDFDILMGPSVSQSRSFRSENGRMTQTVDYSYTFILRGTKEGTFTIPPATIKSGKEIYQSNSISIKVIQGRQPAAGTPQGQPGTATPQATRPASASDEELFIRYEADKKNVYKGEMIAIRFKLYSRVALSVVDQTLPSFEGFWTQDIELPQGNPAPVREAVDGIIYNVYTLQKKIIIPQQTGTLYIEPAEMIFDVQKRVARQSIFDDFFGSYQNIRTSVKSKRVAIQVKELPAAPAGFTGAVGKFSLSSDIDKTSITTNEAITLDVTVNGSGNLKHINPIGFSFPADFEVYEPKTSYNYKASDNGIIGNTRFEQVVIPRYAGDFTIPSQKFIYFDPSVVEYKTLTTKQFDIHVEKGTDDQSATVMSSISKENVRFIGKDVRFIKQDHRKLNHKNQLFFGSLPFYLGYAGLLLVFIVLVLLQQKRLRENADAALMRNKKASKMARKHLKAAATCVRNQNKDEFFDALLRAFWGYLSDKLTIPLSGLNRENVTETLQQYSVDEATIALFLQLVDTCEMARFAPASANEEISELYRKGEQLISKLEKQIRKKTK